MRFPSKQDTLARLRAAGLAPAAVIDIGVLTGTPVLMEAFPDCFHLLIEPESAHRAAIEANYGAIPHRLIQAAASSADGTAALESQSKGGAGAVTHSFVRLATPAEDGAGALVRVARLDTLVAEAGLSGPFLLKIDTDGHEAEVIAGAERTLTQCACVIVEATLDQLTRRAAPLEAAGLRLFDIVDLGYYYDTLSQVDLVFLNPDLFDPPEVSPWRHRTYRWDAWRELQPWPDRLRGRARQLAGRLLGKKA